jgi:Fur family ferric uptake transcriptional regulator
MWQEISRRNTRQRQVVLEELRKLTSHPTAAELHEITRRRLPKISLGTVYRNLELLAQMGRIRKLESSGSETRFDGHVVEHYHVRCVHCGRVDDVHGLPAEPVKHEAAKLEGYELHGYRLEFTGVCPECKAAWAAEAGKAASPSLLSTGEGGGTRPGAGSGQIKSGGADRRKATEYAEREDSKRV